MLGLGKRRNKGDLSERTAPLKMATAWSIACVVTALAACTEPESSAGQEQLVHASRVGNMGLDLSLFAVTVEQRDTQKTVGTLYERALDVPIQLKVEWLIHRLLNSMPLVCHGRTRPSVGYGCVAACSYTHNSRRFPSGSRQ